MSYYAHDGKLSIDPVVVFKIYLLGYLFGIPSERRLMREIAVNLAYRWYLEYDLDEALPGSQCPNRVMTNSMLVITLLTKAVFRQAKFPPKKRSKFPIKSWGIFVALSAA
jgi:transposase